MNNTAEDLNLFSEPILKYKFDLNSYEILNTLYGLEYLPIEGNNCFRSSDCQLLDKLPDLKKCVIEASNDWLNDKMKLNVVYKDMTKYMKRHRKKFFHVFLVWRCLSHSNVRRQFARCC